MNTIKIIAPAVAILVLAGCSTSPTGSNPDVTQRVISSAAAPTPTPTASDNNGPKWKPTQANGTKPFGSYWMFDRYVEDGQDPVFDYDKNFMVEVDRGKTFTPDQYASLDGPKAKVYRKYKITVINNTKDPIDMSGFASISAQDGDETATQVFDGKVGTSPSTQLLSGRKVSWTVGFSDEHDSQVVTVQAYVDETAFSAASYS